MTYNCKILMTSKDNIKMRVLGILPRDHLLRSELYDEICRFVTEELRIDANNIMSAVGFDYGSISNVSYRFVFDICEYRVVTDAWSSLDLSQSECATRRGNLDLVLNRVVPTSNRSRLAYMRFVRFGGDLNAVRAEIRRNEFVRDLSVCCLQ